MLGLVDLNDCYGRLGPRQLALLPWKKGSTLRILAGTTTSEWRRRRWIFKRASGTSAPAAAAAALWKKLLQSCFNPLKKLS